MMMMTYVPTYVRTSVRTSVRTYIHRLIVNFKFLKKNRVKSGRRSVGTMKWRVNVERADER